MAKRHNTTGRSTTERFVSLPHFLLRSPAWRSLSPVARCVFIELAILYNGSNNGRLGLSARVASERVGCSKDTAAKAIAELRAKGFVECRSRGRFDRKSPHASEYRLTHLACEKTGERATSLFTRWHPDLPKSVAGPTRGTAGQVSGTVRASAQESCRSRSDHRDRAPRSETSNGPTTGTHIIYQGEEALGASTGSGSRGERDAA